VESGRGGEKVKNRDPRQVVLKKGGGLIGLFFTYPKERRKRGGKEEQVRVAKSWRQGKRIMYSLTGKSSGS